MANSTRGGRGPPGCPRPSHLRLSPHPRRLLGQSLDQKLGDPGGRQWEGRGRSPGRTGSEGGDEGDDGGENPSGAGRAGTSRSGCGGASGASSAEGGGWPGRSHPAAGAGGAAALPPAPGLRPAARPRRHRPLLGDRLRGRSELWGPPQPRGPLPLRLRLPSARSSVPRCPPRRDGVGAAPRSRAMGRPLGTEQPPEA